MKRHSIQWDKLGDRQRAGLLFLLMFGLVFLRFCYYGFQYFPQLDDYIQLHNQAAYYSAKSVILDMGLLSSRPLASVMDYFFWSRFWPCLMLAVALISALYAASAVLFQRVWRYYFGTGYVFLVIYALLPLGMEGTYWISASNRVVPSLFFAALAMWLFQRWCHGGKWGWLAGYAVTQLISYCFYEQGLVFSVTGVLLVGLLELRARNRRCLGSLLTFVNAAIYFAFTGHFATTTGQLGSRLKVTLPWQEGWKRVFLSAGKQSADAFFLGNYKTIFRGFRRGLSCLLADFNLLYVLALVALCAVLFLCARRFTQEGKDTAAALVVGFLLFLAPITLFFILSDPSIALRNTVFSFCGLALMADAIFNLLVHKAPQRGTITAVCCTAFALVACICSISELHDYRLVYQEDQRAAKAIVAALPDVGAILPGQKVAVLGLSPDYLEEQNFFYHEHIHGATGSPWALMGLLTERSGYRDWPYTASLPAGVMYPDWDGSRKISAMDVLVLYDRQRGTAQEVWAQETGPEQFDIYNSAGDLVARTWEENRVGHLEIIDKIDQEAP